MTDCMRSAAAAQYLGIAQSTLNKSRLTGNGPSFVKIGRRSVVYRKADLDKFLEARVRRSTSEYVTGERPNTLRDDALAEVRPSASCKSPIRGDR
jgi:predicted DNA-binding transcriptional regulator AlpA